MSPSQDREDLGGSGPKQLSSQFALPSKGSSAVAIRSPQHPNGNLSRTPSPEKGRARSPKKGQSIAVSRVNAPTSDLNGLILRPHSTQSQTEKKKQGSPWTSLSYSPIKNASEISNLDIYAPSYVPLWLRAVNDSAAVPSYSSLLQTINLTEYIGNFAGRQYLKPPPDVKLPSIQVVPVVQSTSPEALTTANYATYFWEALHNEVAAEAAELTACNIFEASLEVKDPLRHLFGVKIPGLRENSPRTDIGDVVLLRPLSLRMNAPELTELWYAPGGGKQRGLCAPAFTGFEFHAIVWGVSRPREEILLRVDGLTVLKCNLLFAVQEHRIAPLARSIHFTASSLQRSLPAPTTIDWLRSMLFPMPFDGVVQTTLPQGTFPDMEWIDEQLNYEQQKAVDAVVNSRYGNVPYLISGPPGTGKTKTIVETTLQLLRRPQRLEGDGVTTHQTPHILVCAPSDSAADTLASRLASRLKPVELFRLNGWSRSFPEVPGLLLPYSHIEKDLFSLPNFDWLMSYKVVVTTCRDAHMLVQAQLTNRALSHLTRRTLQATAPGANEAITESQLLHWTALLIDEAAQAIEPEALIPLTVVAPALEAPTKTRQSDCMPQFIMAGDEYQLGPRIHSSNSCALSTSLFARLFSRPFYSQHPLSRQRGSKRLTASILPMKRPAFTNLNRNYRSHPSILSTPSQLFYNDTLIPECTALSDVIRTWPGWKSPHKWPVLFVQNTTPDSVESVLSGNGTGAGALFNHGEVLNALEQVQGLLEHGANERIRQDEIAVVSPFTLQVHLLRKVFRGKGLYDVNIGPLEAFQGLESRVFVLCTTRTRRGEQDQNAAKFVREDQERGLGVIGQPKSFNVAITRAKEGLIVLGDPATLTVEGDPGWEAFISFCARNGCVFHKGKRQASESDWVKEFAKKQGVKEGRLERALVYSMDVKIRETDRKERKDQKGFGYPESPTTRQLKRLSLKGQLPTNDEEMWRTGLQMAEEMDESTLLDGAEEEQGVQNGKEEDPDPWNSDRYLSDRNGDSHGERKRTSSPARESPSMVADAERDSINTNRVFSSASAKEFDRDPKAEFERTDCATQ
jgi:helicase MOV-10